MGVELMTSALTSALLSADTELVVEVVEVVDGLRMGVNGFGLERIEPENKEAIVFIGVGLEVR